MRALLALALFSSAVVGVIACGGNVVVDGSATTTATGTGGGTGGSVGTGGSDVACNSGQFPTFSSACTTATDCGIGIHQTDCCGSTIAIGINANEAAAFASAEKICDAQYPGCGCIGMGPVAQDGQLGTEQTIGVACQAGQCTTFVQ